MTGWAALLIQIIQLCQGPDSLAPPAYLAQTSFQGGKETVEGRCCGSSRSVEFFPTHSPAVLSCAMYPFVLNQENKDCILALAWRSPSLTSPGKASNPSLAGGGRHNSQFRVGRRQAQVIHTHSNHLPRQPRDKTQFKGALLRAAGCEYCE